MAISPQRLTIYLHSAHRAVIFAIAQLSCNSGSKANKTTYKINDIKAHQHTQTQKTQKDRQKILRELEDCTIK